MEPAVQPQTAHAPVVPAAGGVVARRVREHERATAEMRTALAALRVTEHDPQAATAALAPIMNGTVPAFPALWMVTALLLEAIAREALGDPDAAGRALERALDVADRDRVLIPFLIRPAPGLLKRQAGRRTAHAALIAEILGLLAGTNRGPPHRPAMKGDEPGRACASRSARLRPASCTTCPPACP